MLYQIQKPLFMDLKKYNFYFEVNAAAFFSYG
jgi:hypothetical protein